MSGPQVSEAARAQMDKGFECWNSGEIDLMADMYDPEGEFDPSQAFPDMAPVRGREAMVRHWREMWEVWEGIRMEPLDLIPAGVASPGRLFFVVPLRLWGKGKRSGVEVDQRFASLYTLREEDQRVIRNQVFRTVEDAMEAAERQQHQARTR
jgi:hypothetical protein